MLAEGPRPRVRAVGQRGHHLADGERRMSSLERATYCRSTRARPPAVPPWLRLPLPQAAGAGTTSTICLDPDTVVRRHRAPRAIFAPGLAATCCPDGDARRYYHRLQDFGRGVLGVGRRAAQPRRRPPRGRRRARDLVASRRTTPRAARGGAHVGMARAGRAGGRVEAAGHASAQRSPPVLQLELHAATPRRPRRDRPASLLVASFYDDCPDGIARGRSRRGRRPVDVDPRAAARALPSTL